MFDPEKVERVNADNEDRQEIVLASDYDKLLELYREVNLGFLCREVNRDFNQIMERRALLESTMRTAPKQPAGHQR